MGGRKHNARQGRETVLVKPAHVPERKAEGHQLTVSWAIIFLAGDRETLPSSVFYLVSAWPSALGGDP